MNKKIRILIVEDELLIAEDLREMLTGMGYDVMGVKKTGESAITFAAEYEIDLILMDINLSGDIDGITAAEQIKIRKDIPIIFLTAFATDDIVARAKRTKTSGYILKPYSEAQIRTSIEIALYNHHLESQLKERDATIRMLIDTIEDALMLFDSSGSVQFVNSAMATRAGSSADNIVGTRIEDLISTGILSELVFEQLTLARTGKPVVIEEQIGNKWYEYSLIPVKSADGKVTQIGYSAHDISFHKYLEHNLQDMVNHLVEEREDLEQTKEEIHQVNEDLQNYNLARTQEFVFVQKAMAKNQRILTLIDSGNIALKEGMDEPAFLQKICDQIVSYGKYSESWVISFNPAGNPIHMGMSNEDHPNLSDFIEDDGSLRFSPCLGITGTTFFTSGDETGISSPFREKCKGRCALTAPIQSDGVILGIAGVILNSVEILTEQEEKAEFDDICNSVGFALQFVRSSGREKRAFEQISKNIEVMSILNDEIRNPLSIIAGITELNEGRARNIILEQVKRIDNVIDRLDGGFLESIKVYGFLKRHHGFKPDDGE